MPTVVTHLEKPIIERQLLNIPYLVLNTIAHLRKVLDDHGDNTR